MRKLLSLVILLTILFAASSMYGQGTENFNNYVGTSGTYSDGSFVGQDGSTWNYTQCRSDRAIVVPSPCMGKNRTPAASITSGTIHNGCGTISFDYKQAYSTSVDLNLLINGLVVANVSSPGGNGDTATVHNSGPIIVNVSGDFTIKFEQATNSSSGQVTVDNVTWTAHSGSALPEPTNYPTSFNAVASAFTINLSWVDATGAQLPTAYLVLASEENNIDLPIDGIAEPNDPDLTDGTGALNIMPGVQTCQFGSLPSNKHYWFKIFPYTNTGTSINYKTDGTPPADDAITPNVAIINYENFGGGSFGTWMQKSIVGDTTWAIDMTHGVAGTPCAKVSGYYGGVSHQNEDWLISPSMNFNLYTNEEFSFQSAKNYTGPALELYISNNYDGTGNPNNATWAPLTANYSAGGWVWTPSGAINVSGTSGTNVHIAFKFLSTDTESATWEVDELLTTGVQIVGIPEKGETVKFNLTPNPSNGNFSILFSNSAERTVHVISIVGSDIYTTNSSDSKIDINLQGIQSGIYFVKVIDKGTSQSTTKKIIIR